MQLLMENPAAANCGVPKIDLAGASINSEFIASRSLVQGNSRTDRKFGLELAALVFRAQSIPDKPPRSEAKPEIEKPKDRSYAGVSIFEGRKYAHREWADRTGLKLKKGLVSGRLGGEYAYGVDLPEQKERRKVAAREAALRDVATPKRKPLDCEDLVVGSLRSSGSVPREKYWPAGHAACLGIHPVLRDAIVEHRRLREEEANTQRHCPAGAWNGGVVRAGIPLSIAARELRKEMQANDQTGIILDFTINYADGTAWLRRERVPNEKAKARSASDARAFKTIPHIKQEHQ